MTNKENTRGDEHRSDTGLRRSSSIWADSFVRGDLFRDSCTHIFWSNASPKADMNFPKGSIVFCKIDQVLSFFEKLRLTRKRIILVTGEGDLPCDAFRQKFLPENVAHWFATNVTHSHPRVTSLPLGLGAPHDLVTLQTEDFSAAQKEAIERNQWLFVNFRPNTHQQVRQKIFDDFQKRSLQESWITFEKPILLNQKNSFLTQLFRHHFILCPPGNGVDTHRMWESLAAGAFPVVLKSEAMKTFKALPILLVEDFSTLTLNLLQKSLPALETKKKNLFMMKMDFWQKKMAAAQKNLQQQPHLSALEWLWESFWYGLGLIRRRSFKALFSFSLKNS